MRSTFYLNADNFAAIVEGCGAKFNANCVGTTTIVVLGALDKEWSQKCPDLFRGSGKQQAIEKQRGICAAGNRPAGTLHIVSLHAFIEKYGITQEVEDNCFCAKFDGRKSKKAGPGRARSKAMLPGLTLGRLGPGCKLVNLKGLYHECGGIDEPFLCD